jgi:ribonuclease D
MTALVTEPGQLSELARRVGTAPKIAVDAEGNGMHAYRPRLCTLQLAWREDGGTVAAIVDTLAVDPLPLAPLLGPGGPVKVLHDLTFDARILADHGIALGNVEDTSVAARFLDEKSTGLSALSEAHLGVALSKGLQHHDWSQRPLEEEHLAYLAGDVIHLLDLAEVLARRVAERGIAAEVALENAYKLTTGLTPPSGPPDYTRAKGYRELAPVERAVLRRLFAVRDALAAADDVPAHKIAPTPVLIEMARRRPRRAPEIRRLCRGRAARHAAGWIEAVRLGIEDGAPPDHEQPEALLPDRETIDRRRKLERSLTRWRSAEAIRREVSQQVVLPGHCVGPLVAALLAGGSPDDVAAVPGLGELRAVRHLDAWRALLAE